MRIARSRSSCAGTCSTTCGLALVAHVWSLLRVCLRSGFAPFEQIYEVAEWDDRPVYALRTWTSGSRDGPALGAGWPGSDAIEQWLMNGQTALLPMRDLVYYRLGEEGDNWEGESLLRPAYKHWKYKSAIELVQAIGIEKTAIGVPVRLPADRRVGRRRRTAFEESLRHYRANEAAFIMMPGPRADHASTQNGTTGWFIEILTAAVKRGRQADIEAA